MRNTFEYGFIDAVRSQIAKSVKPSLVLELKGPSDGAQQVDPCFTAKSRWRGITAPV
jgi:hypothetical protein